MWDPSFTQCVAKFYEKLKTRSFIKLVALSVLMNAKQVTQ